MRLAAAATSAGSDSASAVPGMVGTPAATAVRFFVAVSYFGVDAFVALTLNEVRGTGADIFEDFTEKREQSLRLRDGRLLAALREWKNVFR